MEFEYKFHCPHCGQKLSATEELSNQTIPCLQCEGSIELPDFAEQSQTEPDAGETVGVTHNYVFAHRLLPQKLWMEDSLVGILANPENRDFLPELWAYVPDMFEVERALAADGLESSSHWIGDEHLVLLVRIPSAHRLADATIVVITTSPSFRYFTFELGLGESGENCTFFCEWFSDGRHVNHGQLEKALDDEAVLYRVCQELSIPKRVDPPTSFQLEGLSKVRKTVINLDGQMKEKNLARFKKLVTTARAAARNRRTLPKAFKFYRKAIKFLRDRDIVKSTYTTDLYSEFVMLLHSARQLDEAVSTCLGWWKLCRRYRMLGHAECLLALNQLALCLMDQGRADEAIGMQNYRLQLVRQSRGRLFPMAQSAEMEVEMFTLLAKAQQSPRSG